MMQSPVASSDFLFFPFPFCLLLSPGVGLNLGDGFWRGFDEVGREDHVEGAIHDHLVKGYKAVIDHRAVAKFLALCQPTLNSDFHRVKNLRWKVTVGGDAPFDNYLLHLDCVGKS